MKENKKLETSDTEVVAETPLTQATKQFKKGSIQHLEYLMNNMEYKGKEIPKDVPYTEYYDYIFRNFRIKKPKEEWTDLDYKAYKSTEMRRYMAYKVRGWAKQETPLSDRQRRIIEKVRNGTDFYVSFEKFGEVFK